jgi:choline dehydrogenase-like flavoprotein
LQQAKDPENLDVLYYALVRQILTENEGETPRAVGVQFLDHLTGRVYQVYAAKEVIVALGAFNSPQLLMVSGMGPASELAKYNIEPVIINEAIGRKYVHPSLK